jgi:hypothetical protein
MSRGGAPSNREPTPPPLPKVWAWPCGCVTRDSRDGPLVQDCGDPRCYRRTRPATRPVGRSAVQRPWGPR